MSEGALDWEGGRTWYRVEGDLGAGGSAPLVVLHGGPGGPHDYLEGVAELATIAGRPCVLYDQIGCGRSQHTTDTDPTPATLPPMGADEKPAGTSFASPAQWEEWLGDNHATSEAKADGRWEAAYDGQRRSVVPEDLQRELDARPRAKAFYAELSSQNRYAIVYRLQDSRKPETRARRLAKFVAMLEAGETIHP
jgi:hypothetical protein